MSEAEGTKSKHTVVIADELWRRLRIAAIEDGQDVSEILSRLAEQYLKSRRSGRRDR
jgi:hypothetical protein